jgi:tetratricopeptide (TPR) repeat protein
LLRRVAHSATVTLPEEYIRGVTLRTRLYSKELTLPAMRRALLLSVLLTLLHAGSSRRKVSKGGSGAKRRARGARLSVDPSSGWPAADVDLAAAAADMGLLEPRRCDFASVDGAALSAEDFARDHLRKAPVVFRGLMDSWPATQGGWEREALLARHGDATVTHAQASDVAQFGPKEGGGKSITSTLRDWVTSAMDSTDGSHAPLAFDRSASNVAYRLQQQGDFTAPKALAPGGMKQLLLSIGPPRAGLPLHTHGDSWLALAHGAKLWMVFPPEWGAATDAAAYDLLALRPVAAILAEKLLSTLPEDRRPLMCVQQAGEVVYLPALWWHATANLDGAVGVGAQNDVDDFTPVNDAGLEDLIAEQPQSGRALYQAAAHFLRPPRGVDSDDSEAAAERLEQGWMLFQSALAAEPFNFNYRAALARAGGALEAVGRALPDGMPRPAAALLEAAALVSDVVSKGVYSEPEAVESLCNLVIAAFGLEDYATSLVIAEQALQLDPAHHSTLNRAALSALFSGQKNLALRHLGTQMNHARDSEEKEYLDKFGSAVFQMPDEPEALIAAAAEMKKSMRRG